MCYTKKIVAPQQSTVGMTKTVCAQIRVPAESIWFDGHFPGWPILPGVAQLAMVVDVVSEALGYPVYATEVHRVRFKQTLPPETPISVVVESRENDPMTFGFRLSSATELACSGFIKVSRTAETPERRNGKSNS